MHPSIALYGPIASGKTTVADILVSEYGYTRVSLTTPLKRLAELSREILHCRQVGALQTDSHAWMERKALVEGLTDKVSHSDFVLASSALNDTLLQPGKPRLWLQQIGTDLFRAADPDVWVRALVNSLPFRGTPPFVVDDMRFQNEAAALAAAGFKLVSCWLPEQSRLQRVASIYEGVMPDETHASECALRDWKDWDGVINTGVPMAAQPGEVEYTLACLEGYSG